ncbi:Signal transduction histidine kinase domain protein [Candidatus Megaera venefica]|uniref:histidine kinase n=1 Tax=Candidatus Megaera venefica TaxID=2055910 RepID=A0ABU5ND88_9RICK|nr:ATP-binding protein [Candidatus Megaera venefica]MEA0971130.1 Signal transduction histidine kinase domain protein [Candidatus Megaera venefica]
MPVVTVPFTLAVLGFRTTSKSALAGMISGFFASLGWMFLDTKVDSVIPGLIVNLVVMLSYHYLLKQPGGWVQKKSPEFAYSSKNQIIEIIRRVNAFSFLGFCKGNCPKNESVYVLFAIFSIISIFSMSYTISGELKVQHHSLIQWLYFSTSVIAVFFLTIFLWSNTFRKKTFISVLWIFGLFYTLTFVVGLFVIMSDFSQFPLMMFILSAVVLSMLVRWQAALALIIVGVISSIYFFKYYAGVGYLEENFGSLQFKIIYMLILVVSVLIAFLKPKQEYVEATEHKVDKLETEVNDLDEKVIHYSQRVADQALEIERLGSTAQKILNNVNHELRLPVGNVMNFAEMLSGGLEKYNKDQLKELSDEVVRNSNRLSTMILNMLDLSMLSTSKIELQKKTVNLSELVEDRVNNCRKVYLQGKKIDFQMSIEPNILIALDPNYIRQTVDNLVINAISYSQNGTIKVSLLRKDKDIVEFEIMDEGIGIAKTELFDIFTPFKMGIKTESKAEGRGVGLALCKSAIEAHGGTIKVESNGTIGATFRFVLSLR